MQKLFYGLRSDESLMLSYQDGKMQAFEVLYGRHKNALFGYLYRQCGRADLVEDISQETWIAVVRGAARYQVTAKFKTFLYQIAHNKMVDHWRRESVRPRPAIQGPEASEPIERVEVSDKGPETRLISDQIQGEISQALMKLAPDQRDAFLLREAGFSQSEIAAIAGVGGETVKSRLRYASKHLKKLLQASVVDAGEVDSTQLSQSAEERS